ncbi:probable inactive 1-aminocyclopropane-1-carboxylate synthase-like protein 2, partial [Eurytemora carolleeae]|uniref:probable inactive 1-aminocyclopropane-1-carboxylate synthase-like protein 2 n=1 Tax=Eurytemora carolleeae TaxID=1294199 RepID=UPI000C778017
MLSKRAYSTYLETEEFLMKSFKECLVNPFCKFENKNGIVNMGTAVNQLCEDILTERINQENMFNHTGEYQHYFGLTGTPDFLQALADFYTRKLGQGERVDCENMRVVNGVTSALEAIAWTICDPEDIILVPTPTYARFFADMKERMRAKVVGVNLSAADGFCLRPQLLEDEILKRQMKGERVRGIIFCNPQNPLGQVYSRELVHEIMRVCSKHGVHIISDEIYAMSVFDGTQFNSVLSFTKEEIPNPDLVHHLWGFSKDFGIAGFRVGAIHSLNQDLIRTIDAMGIFTSVSAHIQQVCVKLLRDEDW